MTESATATGQGNTRVGVLTGGSRGIGRSAVLALAKRGVNVIFTYNVNADRAEDVANEARSFGVRATPLQLDVTKPHTFTRFTEHVQGELDDNGFESLDFLVNNAGIWHTGNLAETTVEDWDRLYQVNIRGLFFVTQALAPLIRDNGGRILNISSGLVRFTFPGKMAYASSKGAVEPMTRYLAAELGPRGITVNALAPGATGTDFSGGVIRDDENYRKRVADITALGRPADPDDIAPVIAMLLSEDAHWITGERIEASGGMRL
jgi:NAD(P)-dependent dehydrogenase (short-subunit alcohol dehydrogenase family)